MLWVIIFLEAKACVSFLVRKAAPNSCFAHVEDQDFAHILCKSQGFCGAFVRMHAGMNRLGPKSWHFRMNLVQIHCLRLINSFVTHPIDAVRICVLVQYFVDRFLEHFFNKQIYMHYMSHQKCADLFRMDDHVPRKSWKHCNQNLADDYWFVGTLSELLYISFSKFSKKTSKVCIPIFVRNPWYHAKNSKINFDLIWYTNESLNWCFDMAHVPDFPCNTPCQGHSVRCGADVSRSLWEGWDDFFLLRVLLVAFIWFMNHKILDKCTWEV